MRLWQVDALVVHGAALRLGGAADLHHEFGDALDMLHGELRIHATLEAVARVRGEVVAARAPGNRLGPPEGGLDVDVLRGVGHGRGVAAHDAGQRLHRVRVGNHAHLVIDGDGVAIEQLELFTRAAPAHFQAAVDLVQVEDVRRTAQLEHHVVGDIDQRRHAALAAARQALDHPLRRAGLGVDVAHDAAGETPAQVGGTDLHRQLVGMANGCHRESQRLQRRPGERGDFTRNAVDAQGMRQVWRELEGKQRVVQVQVLADVLAQRCVQRQLEQAAVVVRQPQFARRAQHAVAFHAAQLAHLDEKRLAIVARRQLGAHLGAGHADAGARIGRAADDGERRSAAHVHLAHAQAIGVGMLHGLLDLADDDLRERGRHGRQFLDLQAGHGQGLGQFLGGQGRIAEFTQPGFGELHSRIARYSGQSAGERQCGFALKTGAGSAYSVLISRTKTSEIIAG